MDDEMLLKTRQIIVTLTLDCFRSSGLYSDRIHFIWIAFLGMIDKPTFVPLPVYKLFGEVLFWYTAFNGELYAND